MVMTEGRTRTRRSGAAWAALRRRAAGFRSDEAGAALFEYALVLFLFAGLIVFIISISWWWWSQYVASTAIHDGVRTAGARYGDLAQGNAVAYERLHAALGRLSADEYREGTAIWADPARRSVMGRVTLERTFNVPFLTPATFRVTVGSFQRRWMFYGGRPQGWE
jgi:Flp pilus assembly protein TadG